LSVANRGFTEAVILTGLINSTEESMVSFLERKEFWECNGLSTPKIKNMNSVLFNGLI
jgi:hypothetical protein